MNREAEAIPEPTAVECLVHHRSRRDRFAFAQEAKLRRRGGKPTEEYVGAHYCVLRVQVPAGRLFGLAHELAKLTATRATPQFIVTGWRNR